MCRPLLSPPRVEFNFSIRTKRNRHNSVRSAYHSQTTLRKVLPFPFRHCFDRHRASSSYCYSTETTNAANYTTTRAANRTSTTRLLLTIIYYFFTLPPPFETCHEQSLLSLSILLYPERKGYATFRRQCRSRPVTSR